MTQLDDFKTSRPLRRYHAWRFESIQDILEDLPGSGKPESVRNAIGKNDKSIPVNSANHYAAVLDPEWFLACDGFCGFNDDSISVACFAICRLA